MKALIYIRVSAGSQVKGVYFLKILRGYKEKVKTFGKINL